MNAVIYARYSSFSQTEQSIEGQLRDCYAYAEREGYTVIKEYIDRAIPGKTDERPDFQRMIEDASKRQFERVIVWKLDRFARNRYDSAIYKYRLRQYGVRVVSAMEAIGDGDESIILEAVLEASAEYYSRDLRKKVNRGLRESALKGSSTGAVPPVGYKLVDKHPVIDEDKAEVVRYIFEQYAQGVPSKKILAALAEKGYTNARGKPFTITGLRCVLSNTKYKGDGHWRDIIVPWPPIVSPELFDQVQDKLKATQHKGAAQKAKVEYYLRGKAYCGYCGAPMVGESGRSRSGENYHYYACADKKKKHSCKKKNERKDFIEWYVVEQTLNYVLTPARMELIAENVVAAYEKEFGGSRIKELERQFAHLDRELDKCVDMMLESDSKPVRKKIEEKAKTIELQMNDISLDLSKLKMASDIHYKKEDVLAFLRQFQNGDLMDLDFRRRVIDVFINSIYLYDDKVIIYCNIHGGKQVSLIDTIPEDQEPARDGGIQDKNVRIWDSLSHHTCGEQFVLRRFFFFVAIRPRFKQHLNHSPLPK